MESKSNERGRASLLRFIAGLLIFHLAAASAFVVLFHYPAKIIALHGAITLAVILCLVFLMGCTALAFGTRGRFPSTILLPTIYVFVFVVFYVTNICSNFGWGSYVNFNLLASSVEHVKGLVEAFPYEADRAACALGLAVLVLGLFFAWASKSLYPALLAAFGSGADGIRPARRRALAAVSLLYLILIVVSILRSYEGYSLGMWQGEPLASLIEQESSGFISTPQRVAMSAKDKLVRAHYPKDASFERRNVVLIVVDALRPMNMQVYGYMRKTTPFLQSLLESGKMYRFPPAVSPCPESVCGIMSTLTSKDYSRMSHASFGLHGLLRDLGYKVSFLLSGDHHWYGLGKFYGQDIDLYRDGRSECPFGINDDRCVLQYIDELPPAGSDHHLLALHLMSVHMAGIQLPEYVAWKPASRSRLLGRTASQEAVINGYDNGVLQADYFISQIFEKLQAKGYLDGAIVVISADHGEGLGEHGLYGHTNHVYQEFLEVPLLVIGAPEMRIGIRKGPSLLDVAPTITDILGLPIPQSWQGTSLLGPPPDVIATFHQTTNPAPYRAVIKEQAHSAGRLKLIIRGESLPAAEEEIYDLERDPQEHYNLLLENTNEYDLDELRKRLSEHYYLDNNSGFR